MEWRGEVDTVLDAGTLAQHRMKCLVSSPDKQDGLGWRSGVIDDRNASSENSFGLRRESNGDRATEARAQRRGTTIGFREVPRVPGERDAGNG